MSTPETTAGKQPGPIMRAAFAYQRWADRFSEWTGKISQYVVLVTVAVGFINVNLRYIGEHTGTQLTSNAWIEAQWYLYSLIFLFGFGYILKHQINVRVDFWFAHQPLKRKAWIDAIGHTIGLIPFAIIGIRYSIPGIMNSWRANEQSPDPSGFPRAPIKTMILVGFIILLIQAIAEFIKVVAVLRDLEDHIEEPDAPIRIE